MQHNAKEEKKINKVSSPAKELVKEESVIKSVNYKLYHKNNTFLTLNEPVYDKGIR